MLSLRKVTLSDALLLAKWFNDKENIKYMSTIIRCANHTEKSVSEEITNYDPDYERLFMVEVDGITIGHAGIDDIDFDDKRAEIFFLIGNEKYRRKGYGSEIVRLLLDHAFLELKLNSIFATSAATNPASTKTLERNGFKRIGIRRQYNLIEGKYHDEIFFDILSSEYSSLRKLF